MVKGIGSGLAWAAIGLGAVATTAPGQVVERERDTKLTGPRGRTIERDIKVERGPGFIDRQVEIKRPGETLIRDTRIQTFPGGRSFGPPRFAGPRYYGGPRFVENVFVPPPQAYGAFIGLPALSFVFGGGGGAPLPPPPPPVVVVPPPVAPAPPPQFDAFTDAVGRLKSFHGSSRRDGALTLGRIGDPRAVPALNERLEHDFDKEVRVASAWALGEIGDEGGAIALERAAIHDKRHEVRDAATIAFKKLPRPGQETNIASGPVPPKTQSATQVPAQPRGVIRSQPEVLDPGPGPNSNPTPPSETNPNAPGRIYPEDTPPPPPTPAISPALEPPAGSGPFRNPS